MKRGAWHQCGANSHKLVDEQLQDGSGVGVVISQRDLSLEGAQAAAENFAAVGAEIVCDPQYYFHGYTNPQLESYPTNDFRKSVSTQKKISSADLKKLASALVSINQSIGATAIVAPAVAYEAGQPELAELNRKLFDAAKQAGNELSIPTYATAIIGRSAAQSDNTLGDTLDRITSLDSDGWYFGFEFEDERIPSSVTSVARCGKSALALAATGRPVLHAFAGPLALLSLGFGATSAAIGPSQNLWRFTRERGQKSKPGGGGPAPPRFFSEALWGTIVYPDEVKQLPTGLQAQILGHSKYSAAVRRNTAWPKWDSKKHLVTVIADMVRRIGETLNPRAGANAALSVLDQSIVLHTKIRKANVSLADKAADYQANWATALRSLLKSQKEDYDYIEKLG